MEIFLSIVIVHTAGTAKEFGWENDVSPPPRHRHYPNSGKVIRAMKL
jgi:hypothetical protein